ncbi:MAG: ATP-binding protein, partial [Deltaproteobacteria bacterium]|nr:ATP-binding protein [Deltaproteobacteria bacterium]
GAVAREDVLAAARGRIAHRLGELAQVVSTTLAWSDLVLRPDVQARVDEVIGAVRHRDRVMTAWGFAAKVPYGRATTALFCGAPGTGKTMVATLIGQELGLEVFRVDLSRVVSKYLGETEANLDRVFTEAARCRAILLFDEADALFARRTDVKSSHDRYANLEVNFLLQRLEAHDGIVILTTNAATSIDPAFARRLRYRVEFPRPDEDERADLWRAMIPAAAPVAPGVDFALLAKHFRMCGGDIKNAVVRAAYLAAAAGKDALDHDVLARGAALEWSELGNLPVSPELLVPRRDEAPLEPRARGSSPALRPPRELDGALDGAIDGAIGGAIDGAIDGLIDGPIGGAIGGAIDGPIGGPIGGPIDGPIGGRTDEPIAAIDPTVESALAGILCAPPRHGETIAANFGRREAELAAVFAALSPPASRLLHRRLAHPAHGDAVAAGFARMTLERRDRLLRFLASAPRRAHLVHLEHAEAN